MRFGQQANTAKSLIARRAWLSWPDSMIAVRPALIVLEATGGLELAVTAALASAGCPVAVVNPRQVRDFAKATGELAKTDRIDASMLAHFAEAIRPRVQAFPTNRRNG